ncbi:polysaccharide lyase family 8 super-sandwich domain-containing protein [Negadavirga shengliensis]|uniref:Polysaccharide lyase family 8 super-sandwich domain-containing protein n=1 Tax=Negadavirga shengliensis TaxID=1389218 RepID=A0ABV9SZB8_9BACT
MKNIYHSIKYSFAFFGLVFTLGMGHAQTNEIETLRERLKVDALEHKGFMPRVEQYMKPEFKEAEAYLNTIEADGSWNDVDYHDRDNEWDPLVALNRTLIMAFAYANPKDKLYEDARLLSGAEKALGYWYKVNPVCDNWYKNRIAKQMYLGVIGLLLQDAVDDSLLQKIIEDQTDMPAMTGSNRTLLATSVFYRGVLEKNSERIMSGVKGVIDQVEIGEKEGIQQDYSFHQHGPYLYNGSYGSNFLRETIWMAAMVQGTRFAFTEDYLKVLRDYYFQGTRWMVRKGVLDYNVRGRQVGRPSGFDQRAEILVPQLAYFIKGDPAFQEEYRQSKESILKSRPQVIGNKHFWRSDYTVHHRQDHFTSLRMCSERTIGVEIDVNSENLLGYYLPYGLTYIYRRGDEYEDIFPVWDWARLPGVTNPHEIPVIKGNFSQEVAFVGGVSDGAYGVSAMELDVKATKGRKSWFWFDKEWVALGTDITSESDSLVTTSINQTRLHGEVLVDGEIFPHGEAKIKAPSWIWHDSVAYVFPDSPKELKLEAGEKSGRLNLIFGLGPDSLYRQEVFSVWYEHGIKPINESYAYAVLPGVSPETAKRYTQNPLVNIVSNTSRIQAVAHKDLKITGIVFYEAGGFQAHDNLWLEVNAPCLVLVNHKTEELTISDPTPLLKTLELVLKSGEGEERHVQVSLPRGLDAGKSVAVKNQEK